MICISIRWILSRISFKLLRRLVFGFCIMMIKKGWIMIENTNRNNGENDVDVDNYHEDGTKKVIITIRLLWLRRWGLWWWRRWPYWWGWCCWQRWQYKAFCGETKRDLPPGSRGQLLPCRLLNYYGNLLTAHCSLLVAPNLWTYNVCFICTAKFLRLCLKHVLLAQFRLLMYLFRKGFKCFTISNNMCLPPIQCHDILIFLADSPLYCSLLCFVVQKDELVETELRTKTKS